MKKERKEYEEPPVENYFHEMKKARRELYVTKKEANYAFIGIFLFLSGFLFNLTANIVYNLIQQSAEWRIFILFITIASLILLVVFVRRYLLIPIMKQKEKLEKLKKEEALFERREGKA